jgi:hypothetical protein
MNLALARYGATTNRVLPTLVRAAPTAGNAGELAQFTALVNGFRRTGGLASSDEVLCWLRPHADQPISVLARWIVTRQAVSFEWQGCILLPVFQFDREGMALRAGPREVALELRGAFDDWDVAYWFSQPNSWLSGVAPVDLISTDQAAVLQAARADRFIARG